MSIRWLQRCLGWTCLLLFALACLSPLVAEAERPALKLAVHKVKGADLLGRVTGIFRVAVQEPSDVSMVTFYMDGQVIAHAYSEPYAFQLDTRDFPKGAHTIEAVGYLDSGVVATSNTISLEFRSSNWHLAVRQSMLLYAGLIIVILGAIGTVSVRRLLHMHPRTILLDR